MKINVYGMSDDELCDFIAKELEIARAEIGRHSSIANGPPKVQLSELQKYSQYLQKPVLHGNERALKLKTEIDGYLEQFQPTAMVRPVQPVDMTQYHKKNNDYKEVFKPKY